MTTLEINFSTTNRLESARQNEVSTNNGDEAAAETSSSHLSTLGDPRIDTLASVADNIIFKRA
jgi:hypothetical protein